MKRGDSVIKAVLWCEAVLPPTGLCGKNGSSCRGLRLVTARASSRKTALRQAVHLLRADYL